MFTTLRIKDTALVPERESHVLSHLACRTCRFRKLKCTGESTGCRRCVSKDITCTYPDPSQRTRRSKDNQKRARPKQVPQPLPIGHSSDTPPFSDLTATGQEIGPALPSPWNSTALLGTRDGSFLDGLLGDPSLSQEPSYWSGDLQVEGADFFPIDHYSCLNEFLGTSEADHLESSSSSLPSFPSPRSYHPEPIPSTALPTGQDQCTCLQTTLTLLTTHTLSPTLHLNIPRTITLNKRTLHQLLPLFTCNTCTASTSAQTMTLLTILCQKIISSYENIIALLAHKYFTFHSLPLDTVPAWLRIHFENTEMESGGEVDGEGEEGLIQVREYEVEKCEETCLFAGLVTIQLGILRAFLGRLKGAPEQVAGEYVGLLEEVDGRVLKLGQYCSRSCEI